MSEMFNSGTVKGRNDSCREIERFNNVYLNKAAEKIENMCFNHR